MASVSGGRAILSGLGGPDGVGYLAALFVFANRVNRMTEMESLQTNRIYSIALMKEDSQWCVYHVKVKGDIQREFFAETVASRIPRGESIRRIKSLCESNCDRLPQDGGVIHFNLETFAAAF
jgi:hypothetical protein